MLYVPKKERIPEEKPILKHKSDFFILTLHFFGGGVTGLFCCLQLAAYYLEDSLLDTNTLTLQTL